MKYTSVNKIGDFEFHDAIFSLINFEKGCLEVSVKYLNIHKTAEENPEGVDMEIEKAMIVFRNFHIEYIKRIAEYEKDKDGSVVPSKYEILEGEEAYEMFLSELKHGLTVYYLGVDEERIHYLDGCGEDPYFNTFFTYDEVSVKWDDFLKPAWYEHHK